MNDNVTPEGHTGSLPSDRQGTRDPFQNCKASDVLMFYMYVVDAIVIGLAIHGEITRSYAHFGLALWLLALGFAIGLISVSVYAHELDSHK